MLEITLFPCKIKSMKRWLMAWALLAWGFSSIGMGALGYPTPVDPANSATSPYLYTGLVSTPDSWGSGGVAVHPRLVLGCGHMNLTDTDTWHPAGLIEWFWKWNQGGEPTSGDGVALTGYYYFSNYRSNVLRYGMDSPRTFQVDFIANYSATRDLAGGYAGGWVEDGKKYLTTGGRSKMISGYPSGRYDSGDPDEFRMHSTEFSQNMEVDRENYLGLDGVETGAGNSGGPVWVWENGAWAFAGVLVSGLEVALDGWSSIGVCAVNPGAWGLITSALRKTGTASGLFRASVPLANVPEVIPDQSTASVTFPVANVVGVIQGVKLNLSVNHQRQGDLIVTLRSPTGRTVTLLSAVAKNKASKRNLVFTSKTISGFSGLSANGIWTLTVKDAYRLDTGSIQSGSLEVTTR